MKNIDLISIDEKKKRKKKRGIKIRKTRNC